VIFFLCGKPKEKVYQSQPKTLDELEQAIQDMFATLPVDFLRKNVEFVSSRLL
jgi:hypothetical protein